jgi:hypothetical protein
MNIKILLPIAVVALGCIVLAPAKEQKPKYRKIFFSMTIPGILPYGNGEVDERPSIQNTIDGGDCTIYEFTHREFFSEEGVFIRDTTYFDIFVHQKGAKYGYMLRSLTDSFTKRIAVDSIVGVRTLVFADIGKTLKATILAQTIYPNQYEMVRKYAVDDAIYDSATYYYDKRLMDIPYSYSPTLDSQYQSKLHKVELILKKDKRERDATGKDFRMNTVSLGVSPVESEQALDSFFVRFKRETAGR